MKVTVFDRSTYKITKREYMDNGFLKVPGRVARTGIQEYLACELGLDGDPMRVIKVMRPEDEVFNSDSLSSYNGVDVTIEHPSKFVDAESYSTISKGTALDAVRDGDFVKANLIVKSKDAIQAIESGKVELSAGYSATYDEAPKDEPYDFIQRNIIINHVAIVDKARAGRQARLFDTNNPNLPENTMKKVVLDSGRSVELEDGATATLIQDSFDRLNKQFEDSAKELETVKATSDAQAEKITKLEEDLKAATDSEALNKRIAEVAKVKDSALKIAGKDFACDSVDLVTIKREALKAVRDSIDWDQKDEAYVNAAFDFADADMKKSDKKDEDEEETKDSQLKQLAKDAMSTVVKSVDSRGKRQYMDSNLWKVNAGQMTMQELEAQAKEQFGG